MIGKRNTD